MVAGGESRSLDRNPSRPDPPAALALWASRLEKSLHNLDQSVRGLPRLSPALSLKRITLPISTNSAVHLSGVVTNDGEATPNRLPVTGGKSSTVLLNGAGSLCNNKSSERILNSKPYRSKDGGGGLFDKYSL